MAAAPKKRGGARASNAQPGRAGRPLAWWRRLLGGLLTLGLVGGVFGAGYLKLSEPDSLPLRVIEVSGEFQQLDRAEIQQAVAAAIDGGFFTCDMQRLRNAVLAMPWVADVSIRRAWPDKLHMMVTEQVPLARWGERALINVNGGVFEPEHLGNYAALVRLSGPAGSEQRVVQFHQAVVPLALSRELLVREVELDERRHWWLRFEGGLTVSLGRDDVDNRLMQFFRVYPSLLSEPSRRPERVDMRYTHGFAVRWQLQETDESATAVSKSQGNV